MDYSKQGQGAFNTTNLMINRLGALAKSSLEKVAPEFQAFADTGEYEYPETDNQQALNDSMNSLAALGKYQVMMNNIRPANRK